MIIHAVIGAQYGDEGKGLLTDYLSTSETLVVRFNGGAQAGHTVVTPEGHRHEFHHVGAGLFRGAQTLLSRHFLVNPIILAQEVQALKFPMKLLVDPRAQVTTPFDMLLNRAIEHKRNGNRHGSCGLGINETVTRATHHPFTVGECFALSTLQLQTRLKEILEHWVPSRECALDVEPVALARRAETIDRFIEDIGVLRMYTRLVHDATIIKQSAHVVFEGAQGLRLDEKSPDFPHVTRSRTGLTNVVELLKEAQCEELLNVYYVTRAYTTRHGAGRLPAETNGHPYGWNGPETNVLNPWQGAFRYAYLQPFELATAVRRDLACHPWNVVPRLAVTCLDQVPEHIDPEQIAEAVGIPLGLVSHGPTRGDVSTTLFPRKETLADA